MPATGGGSRCRILAIYGMPGVGKSRLARALYELLAPSHDGKQIYVSCDPDRPEPATLEAIADRIAAETGWTSPADGSVARCFQYLKAYFQNPRNLIVVDDLAAGPDRLIVDQFVESAELRDSTIILVSRYRPLRYNTAQLHEVRPLTDEHSEQLLCELLGADVRQHFPRDFADVVRYCEGLPRALYAVRTAVAEGSSLAAVAQALRDPMRCLEMLSRDGHDLAQELAAAHSTLDDDQRRTLAAISLLRSPTVGAEAVALVAGDAEPLVTAGRLAKLEDVRLLSVRPADPAAQSEGPRFRLGRLVGLALQKRLEHDRKQFALSREQLDTYYRTKVDEIYSVWVHETPTDNFATYEVLNLLDKEHRDILYASAVAAPDDDRPCWRLAHVITGLFPRVSCDWPMWAEFFTHARTTAEALRHRERVERALQATRQADGLRLLFAGCLDRAETSLNASLDYAAERLSRDPDMLIRAHVHLAELLMERGLYQEAQMHITQVAAIEDPRPQDQDQPWAKFISAVVSRNLLLGAWHRVELLEKVRPDAVEDPTRRSRMSLYVADVLREIGQGASAEEAYLDARRIAEESGDHFAVARADYSRAMLYLDWGNLEQAKRLIEWVRPAYTANTDDLWSRRFEYLEIRAAQLDPGHPDAGRVSAQLDRLMRAVDPHKDAWLHVNVTLLQVQTLLDRKEFARARRDIDNLLLRLRREDVWVEARALVLLGRIRRAEGDYRRARADLNKARKLFVQCRDVCGELLAYRELTSARRGLGIAHPQRFTARRLARRNARQRPLCLPEPRPRTRPDLWLGPEYQGA